MSHVKAWKEGESQQPRFPKTFSVQRKAVLQVTDLTSNHNKYYCLELHEAAKGTGKTYRVDTHYGRTDDLEQNPAAGVRESRFFRGVHEAQGEYDRLYRQKTAASKGYREVHLASTRIGSSQSAGQSSGQVDDDTLSKVPGAKAAKRKRGSKLDPDVQRLVRRLYEEATGALTSRVQAKITAKGIETPLGVLTLGQIEEGQRILDEARGVFGAKRKRNRKAELERLSGEFYTAIPHRLGRTRQAIAGATLDRLEQFQEKSDTLQLMRDMLQVNGDGNVLFDAEVDGQYEALKCSIKSLPKSHKDHRRIRKHVLDSQLGSDLTVERVYAVKRPAEWTRFQSKIPDQRLLFHGSQAGHWVGILSRGLLLPKAVVRIGVDRTDEGWLGHGIYFGDSATTAAAYASHWGSTRGTCFLGVFRVALGKIRDYTEITHGLTKPPKGYQSCHGVRADGDVDSEFDDDEFVIYSADQQRQEFVVEYSE